MNLLRLYLLGYAIVTFPECFANSQHTPTWNETYVDLLRRDLLHNYDKFARPTQHYNVTTVRFGLSAHHFDINEKESSFSILCYAHMMWDDEKLKWNSSDYGNLTAVNFADHEVWRPDVFAYNSATALGVNTFGSIPVILYNNGEVLWVPLAQFTVLCDIDLTYWPFDTQTCQLIFGSWTYHGGQIDLRIYNNETEIYDEHLTDSHEWKYISSTATRESKKYECCEEEYPSISFNITLQRVSPSYKAVVVSPAFAVILLILMTFWLPPQTCERIFLQGIAAIIIVWYLLHFTQKLPAMGNNTPLIVSFYSHALFIVCLSMIGSIAVIWLARTSYSQHLPWRIKHFLTGKVGKILCLGYYIAQTKIKLQVNSEDFQDHHRNGEIDDIDQHTIDDEHYIIGASNCQASQQDWILFAVAIDRISFCFYTVLFIILGISYSL